MEEDNSKVLSINSKHGFTYKKSPRHEDGYCFHRNVVVDEQSRTIECDKCGVVMDAFDFLKSCCYEEDNAFVRLGQLKIEVAKLEKRYKNLNSEIQRLSRIKNDLKQSSK